MKIFVYAMLMFSSTFFILKMERISNNDSQKNSGQQSSQDSKKSKRDSFLNEIISQIAFVYEIVYGSFEINSEVDTAENVIIVATSMFLTIIMLNIVIAIMADTYGRVMNNAP